MKLIRKKYNWLDREGQDEISLSELRTWGDVAIAGAAIVGGYMAGQGAQNAANTQAGAAENAQQISQQEFNTITAQEQPFMQGGYGAMNELDYLLGIGSPSQYGTGAQGTSPYFTSMNGAPGMGMGAYIPTGGGPGQKFNESSGLYGPNGFSRSGHAMGPVIAWNPGTPGSSPMSSAAGGFGSLLQPFNVNDWKQLSPAYNFQRQQGIQGVLGADSSSAGALSGAAQKDLISFNQNLANTSFNNAFNMYQTQQGNIYDRLAGIAQLGQAAASNTGQQGTALAGQAAQSATNIGTALGAGQIGAANAYSGAIGNLGALAFLNTGNGNYQQSGNAFGNYPSGANG